MTTTCKVASSIADSHALATDSSHTELLSCLIQLEALNTSTNLESRARVRGGGVGLIEVDTLEVMSPNGKGTGSRGATVEVMASVLDHETNVEIAGKVDCELDLRHIRGLDDVRGETTDGAGAGGAVVD